MKCKIPWKPQTIKAHSRRNSLNSLTSITDIEFINKNLPTKKASGSSDFICEFCQILNENIRMILLKLFKKIEKGNMHQLIWNLVQLIQW